MPAEAAGFFEIGPQLPVLFAIAFATVVASGVQYVWMGTARAIAAPTAHGTAPTPACEVGLDQRADLAVDQGPERVAQEESQFDSPLSEALQLALLSRVISTLERKPSPFGSGLLSMSYASVIALQKSAAAARAAASAAVSRRSCRANREEVFIDTPY